MQDAKSAERRTRFFFGTYSNKALHCPLVSTYREPRLVVISQRERESFL